MLVQCPNCRTTYRVSDEVVKQGAPGFRCSRCKHTFELEPAENQKEAPQQRQGIEAPTSEGGADQELDLPFAPKHGSDSIQSVKPNVVELPNAHTESIAAEKQHQLQWAINDETQDEDKSFIMTEAEVPEDATKARRDDFDLDDPVFRKLEFDAPSENPNNITAISPYLEQRASIKPFLTLFILLVIGFSLLTAISQARPEAPESVLKKIPLIGATVLRNNHLKEGILLKSLTTSYQTIQGNRNVFLVSGVAVNQNPVVVREIQLTGTIYNETGKELERQTIWVGNTLSPKIIRGMTIEDIPQLQDLKPLKSFEIPPGDSVPFTIVFLKSAKNAKEFSCAVNTAAGEV